VAEDNLYQPGDVVPLEATFTNAAGTPTNTTVTLTVRDPSGSMSTPAPTNLSAGVYHYDYALAANAPEGVWEYIFAGTGTVTAAERKTFVVEPVSLLARLDSNALVTLADVRGFVFRDPLDNRQDRELVERINEYSRAVMRYTGREWLPQTTAATRSFSYDGGGFLSFAPFEARTVTSVSLFTDQPSVGQVTLTAPGGSVEGQWRLFPPNKSEEGTYFGIDLPMLGRTPRFVDGDPWWGTGWSFPSVYFRGRTNATVTGDWGVATSLAGVPSDVQLAVKIAIKDAYTNPAGFSSGDISGGGSFTEEPIDSGAGSSVQFANLPYEARALLEPYRRTQAYVFA
jgi:hypothetical protein